jgi:hypothetical protein
MKKEGTKKGVNEGAPDVRINMKEVRGGRRRRRRRKERREWREWREGTRECRKEEVKELGRGEQRNEGR